MRPLFVPVLALLAGLLASPAVAAPPRELWFYYSTNLQTDANVDKLEPIWRRAAAAGYSKVLLADSKLARLGNLGGMEGRYTANVARVRKLAGELKLDIVPAVFPVGYSNALLFHDPNLAEGLAVRDQLFVVGADGAARNVADPPVSLEKIGFKDDSVALNAGVATVRDNPANARLTFKLAVAPYRCYHVAVKVRTRDFTGTPEVKALAGNTSLQWQNLGTKRTQDWTEHHIVFDSLEHDAVNVYFGVWGPAKGTLEWKDWRIEESPLVNVLRRAGTPVVVRVEGQAAPLVEGREYDAITDPLMGIKPWPGEYEAWHAPPAFKTRLKEGTRLRVGWYFPPIIYDGQVSACLSEAKTADLLADEARRVRALFGAAGYLMSHDELRCANRDAACEARHLDAGPLLADNARACAKLLQGSTTYVWSDMFDPAHNAHGDYYLVKGDLKDSWAGLDKSVVIVNWNFAKRDESLRFFASRGHRQVIAGYYDGPVDRVKQWLASADQTQGVIGIMYTSWKNNYADLEAFARACAK